MKRRKFLKGLGSAALIGAASSGKAAGFFSGATSPLPGSTSPAKNLPDPRIQHVIVLMMENRSFDHMLGYCRIDGVDGVWDKEQECFNEYKGRKIHTNQEAKPAGDLKPDPGHDFCDVRTQLYFPDFGTSDPQMKGFIQSFSQYENRGAEPPNIMKCFAPENVPVLSRLAREFVVCNRWFASIPGPTLPNRLFAHAGTSRGRLDMSAAEFHTTPTVYEVLGQDNVSSTIYADGWTATSTFLELMKYQYQFFGTMDDFYQDCYDNQLPGYCFLEPRYSSGMVDGVFRPQNDQHPDSDVTEGEDLIYSVYNAIRSNRKVWEHSMLVITYDEHGGLYDHVPPPNAIPPGDGSQGDLGFAFDRYGVRVPAIIVSAYTDHDVLNDTFDHTSLIATARKLLTGNYRDAKLWQRAMNANTFDKALNRTGSPRPNDIELPRPEVQRGPNDKKALEADLNHLQIMNLQQALLVNSSLPKSLQIKPKSILGKEVSNDSKEVEFNGITVQKADHYIRRVQSAARGTSTLQKAQSKPGMAQCEN